MLSYFPDGALAERELYNNGVREGLQQRYHANGKLALKAQYLNGQLLDPGQRYAEDGRPLDAAGKPVSRLKWWWSNGAEE